MSPGSHGLVTPLEPRRGRAPAAAGAVSTQHADYGSALCRIEAAAATACGRQHAVNEDAHTPLDAAGPPFVVADGVGGGAMAELASRRLVAHLHAQLGGRRVDPGRIEQAMLDADRSIARRIAQLTDAPGAATVALCAPANVVGSRWLVAWVGDCRVYRIAAGAQAEDGVELLTRDDTFRHLGETPPPGGSPDDPARMVGNGATSGANVAVHDVAAGDVLALCSDGVHRHLEAADWTRILDRPHDLAARCAALVETARERGSLDDATVLLVRYAGIGWPRTRGGRAEPRGGIA
jgi:protein phosphatase